ncbi:MAG: hypothetical protein DRR08_33355 [Candidatus Parabeggiatoa sp. nov. 2]|nr:MAG: hypothetical protein DRR08_33355 [Gammaproteobacteria bacterium]HEC85012.1 hypothetical protein [Thioploca sp.]
MNIASKKVKPAPSFRPIVIFIYVFSFLTVISDQLSVISYQLSVISDQFSGVVPSFSHLSL